ncbi:hypothetical protein ACOMHN_013160 [Nucella lapillus]
MYGRKARLPIDLKSENESDDHQSADVDKEADPDKLQTIQEIRRGLNDKVSESIARAQQHQKEPGAITTQPQWRSGLLCSSKTADESTEWERRWNRDGLKTDTAIYLENGSDHFNVVLSVA